MDSHTETRSAFCFISYARGDDEIFNGAVLDFKKTLEGMYEQKTGYPLTAYMDRVDLDWGERWREGISEAVQNATAFLPIITMKYFTRDACREELVAFHNDAKIRGVGELILPIVISGASRLRMDDPREEVRIIASRQYKNLEQAFLAGHGTREWREEISKVTDHLIDILEQAERHLSVVNPVSGVAVKEGTELAKSRRPVPEIALGSSNQEEEELGFLDLAAKFEDLFKEVETVFSLTVASFDTWSTAMQDSFSRMEGKTPNEIRALAFQAATQLREPSQEFGDNASQLAADVSECDAILRLMLNELEGLELPETQKLARQIGGALRANEDRSAEMSDLFEQMNQAVEYMKMAGKMSVPLRRALSPAQNGIKAIRDVAEIFNRWSQLSLPE